MSEETAHYIGQRISFDASLCTVHYIGNVKGTNGVWLGVEWDDPRAGKHQGSHNGDQYFKCKSSSLIAASFVRPKRPADPARSFLDAIRHKYIDDSNRHNTTITFNTKVAQEVGFDKIKHAQGNLHDLRVVLIDGQRLAGPTIVRGQFEDDFQEWEREASAISVACPQVKELDLSQNLLETLLEIACICRALPELRTLTLNGNRFRAIGIPQHFSEAVKGAFESVVELNLNEDLLSWTQIVTITSFFSNIQTLSCAANALSSLPTGMTTWSLHTLSLAHNNIRSFMDLEPLKQLRKLKALSLHDNAFSSVAPAPLFDTLDTLDISFNKITAISSLDAIATSFPNLTNLRVSGNPFFVQLPADDAQMLSLARVASITTLNYSDICPDERENAELYYMSRVAAELGAVAKENEGDVLVYHQWWSVLCQKYGEPSIRRATDEDWAPGTLGARLILLNLKSGRAGTFNKLQSMKIPRSINMYTLKSLVSDEIDMLPSQFKLVWETGEWDPVGSNELVQTDEAKFDVGSPFEAPYTQLEPRGSTEHGRWVKREVELLEGTSSIGFWIEGNKAQVRIDVTGSNLGI